MGWAPDIGVSLGLAILAGVELDQVFPTGGMGDAGDMVSAEER